MNKPCFVEWSHDAASSEVVIRPDSYDQAARWRKTERGGSQASEKLEFEPHQPQVWMMTRTNSFRKPRRVPLTHQEMLGSGARSRRSETVRT